MNDSPHQKRAIKNSFAILIILVVIVSGIVIVMSGQFESGIEYAKVKLGLSNQKTNFVTYYQWTSPSGNMVISRDQPSSGEYITFEAAEDLQDTNYDVDSEVLEKGRQYREELVSVNSDEKNPKSTVQQQEKQTSKHRSIIDKVKACIKVADDISKANRMLQETVSDKVHNQYQELLRDAKWRKMKYKC